jgi:hypothetical protein
LETRLMDNGLIDRASEKDKRIQISNSNIAEMRQVYERTFLKVQAHSKMTIAQMCQPSVVTTMVSQCNLFFSIQKLFSLVFVGAYFQCCLSDLISCYIIHAYRKKYNLKESNLVSNFINWDVDKARVVIGSIVIWYLRLRIIRLLAYGYLQNRLFKELF